MEKVDVIIPTYNRSEFLRSAIQSILDQTYQDFRIIVVDDASTEAVYDVVKRFSDKRIAYLRHQTNTGEAGARNTGVKNSKAEYIAFLDDDDEWLPDKLRLQVALLDKSSSKVGGIYTGFYAVDKPTGKILGRRVPKRRGYIHDDMIVENAVGTSSTVLLRRECFERVGLFDQDIAWGLDYDMWIRISEGFEFEFIKDPLVKYHVHRDQISNNLQMRILGIEALLNKYRKKFVLNKKAFSAHYYSLGRVCQKNNNLLKAWRSLLKAISLYPFEVKYYNCPCKAIALFIMGRKNCYWLKDFKVRLFGDENHKKPEGYWDVLTEE
jgi:glycosyltransferase involved in cell wall biosynthesis